MDTKQFIASLVSSLAWPIVALVIALLFRRQLAQLLTAPIKRLKAGPVEFEFDRIISTVEARIEPVPVGASPEATTDTAVVELASVAHDWPPGAVMEGFNRVEVELRERLRAVGHRAGDDPKYSAGILARHAREEGLITPETAEALEGITVLRNLVAHGRASEITEDRALDYLALVDAVLFSIRRNAGGQQGGN